MTTRVRVLGVLSLVVVVGGCRDPLLAKNLNNPDVIRVFAQPASIEQTIAGAYQVCRNVGIGGTDMYQQLSTMALENYSQLNNFSMGPRGAIPRSPILNNKSTSQALAGTFSAWHRNARLVSNAVAALDRLTRNGGTLGTPAQNLRARAWGFFAIGCNLGWLAASYDSAAAVDHLMASDSIPPLEGAKVVMDKALALMDSAIAVANDPASTGSGGFPTPAAWLSGVSLSRDNFVRFVRSYKARFRAYVARTPAERAAVDWAKVIADAENGITADVVVSVGGTSGWNIGFQGAQMHVDAAWHQMSPFYWGFADVSGGYDTWLATPLTAKNGYFLIVSPDLRWPQGTTRPAQRAGSPNPGNYLSRPYIENRTLQDTPGDPWGSSFYNYYRYKYIQLGSNQGSYPEFLKAEVDLLAAEGYIRAGQIAQAAAKIDVTRVGRGGLPALSGAVTSLNDPVPGGANCVPRVPAPPTYTSTACGNIFEAMKYEKRMELAFNHLGSWFYDSRGWGDLITQTPLEYPVPVNEMEARYGPAARFYNLGGGGPSSQASPNTYRFP